MWFWTLQSIFTSFSCSHFNKIAMHKLETNTNKYYTHTLHSVESSKTNNQVDDAIHSTCDSVYSSDNKTSSKTKLTANNNRSDKNR